LLGERHELLMLPGNLCGDRLVLAGQLRLCLPYLRLCLGQRVDDAVELVALTD
jgi:hypothetical protein